MTLFRGLGYLDIRIWGLGDWVIWEKDANSHISQYPNLSFLIP